MIKVICRVGNMTSDWLIGGTWSSASHWLCNMRRRAEEAGYRVVNTRYDDKERLTSFTAKRETGEIEISVGERVQTS